VASCDVTLGGGNIARFGTSFSGGGGTLSLWALDFLSRNVLPDVDERRPGNRRDIVSDDDAADGNWEGRSRTRTESGCPVLLIRKSDINWVRSSKD